MAIVRTGYANFASFPVTGAINIIYVDLSNGNEYTWIGTAYVAYEGTKVSIREGYKDAAWFTANPTFLLGKGQKVNLEQTGTYKLGDGITQLSALSFLGGGGGSFVESVTGNVVDNTDPLNPTINPTLQQITDNSASTTSPIEAQSFITTGGLVTDFVKGDGSLDSTVYTSKTYVDGLVVGLLDDRGGWDASSNLFPTTGGSGVAGAILKGDIWFVSVDGVLSGLNVTVGDSFRALTDTPGQTDANWSVIETNIGYVPENVDNKVTTMSGYETDNVVYLTAKAIYDWAVGLFVKKGTLTTNYLQKATNSSTIGDSTAYDNGTSFLINTTAPIGSERFGVNGVSIFRSEIDMLGNTCKVAFYDNGLALRGSLLYDLGKFNLQSGGSDKLYLNDLMNNVVVKLLEFPNETASRIAVLDASNILRSGTIDPSTLQTGTDIDEPFTVTGTTQVLGHTPTFVYGIYQNGQRLVNTIDYTISVATITFTNSLSSDQISAVYKY